jgi:hypothetical protein
MFSSKAMVVSLWSFVAVTQAASTADACGPCSCYPPWGIRPALDTLKQAPLNARFLVELSDFDESGKRTPVEVNQVRWSDVDEEIPVAFDVLS